MKLIVIVFIINIYQTYSFLCGPSGIEIKNEWVNDGYCDCPEENDENETGACSNESKENSFLCKNNNLKRYQKTIPLSYLNDGACDCEDGSDEPKGRCENILPKLLKNELEEKNKKKNDRKSELDSIMKMKEKGKKSLQKRLELIEQYEREMKELQKNERLWEKRRLKHLSFLIENTVDETKRQQLENAKNIEIDDVIYFGWKQLYNSVLRIFDNDGLIENNNPEGVNDIIYCIIRHQLGKIAKKIRYGEKLKLEKPKLKEIELYDEYCLYSTIDQCLTYENYQLCLFEVLTENGKLLGSFEHFEVNQLVYSGIIENTIHMHYVSFVCGKEQKIESITKKNNNTVEIVVQSPCGCSEYDLFNDINDEIESIEKNIKEVENNIRNTLNEMKKENENENTQEQYEL